jgi:hypothetical protein
MDMRLRRCAYAAAADIRMTIWHVPLGMLSGMTSPLRNLILFVLVMAMAGGVLMAQQSSGPVLSGKLGPSANIHPPMGEKLLFKAHARGRQIYTCMSQEGGYAWKLKAPDAKLFDAEGRQMGTHSAGPTWTLTDGSSVKGTAVSSRKSAYSDAVPWLLVSVVAHAGKGRLSGVDYVQRTDTHGGAAPASGCDAAHADAETGVEYTAVYGFYGKQ